MLPTLSRLSVSVSPGRRLRRRYSSRYLRISPLHREFPFPLLHSSLPVSNALPRLSRGLSHLTWHTAYTRFTPSDSEQRLHPPYYRGCWHGVSRCFLGGYRLVPLLGHSSPPTELYDPQAFITHAALLRQAFAHCAIFPTAASRRSLDRVSVPVWLIILSDQLSIEALVSRYLTNKLMDRGPIPRHRNFGPRSINLEHYAVLAPVSRGYPRLGAGCPRVTHPCATLITPRRTLSRSTCMCYARRQRSF